MEFSIAAGLVAGFVATTVMSVMMKMAGGAGMTDMPPMEPVTGPRCCPWWAPRHGRSASVWDWRTAPWSASSSCR